MRRALAGVVCLVGALLLPAVSHAEAPDSSPCAQPELVKSLKERGDQAMESARPSEALAAYEQAFAACKGSSAPPLPGAPGVARAALVYNLGRAHLALGDFAQALNYFEEFERTAPADLRSRVPDLGTLIDEQRARVGTLTVTSNVRGAKIRVREKSIGDAPLPPAMRVNAGPAVIEVSAEGYLPFTQQTNIRAGALTTVVATLALRPVVVRPPPEQLGTLAVSSPVTRALVFIDGNPYGTVPMEQKLAVGAHRVLVRLDGYRDADRQITLAQGERRELTLTPERIAPITAKWWFWTTLGAVAAAGATATILVATSERSPAQSTLPGAPQTVVAGTFAPFRFSP